MGNSAIKKNEECVKFFCKTIAKLNKISLKQIEGLLDVAITAGKELNSDSNSSEVEQFIDKLKIVVEELSQNAQKQEKELYENLKNSLTEKPENSFCQAVEQKLIVAFENSLANQQQLNITGNALLAQAASLLLTPKTKE